MHQAVSLGISEGTQKRRVHHTENGGVRAYPQSESQHGDNGKAGILDQCAETVAQILEKYAHPSPPDYPLIMKESLTKSKCEFTVSDFLPAGSLNFPHQILVRNSFKKVALFYVWRNRLLAGESRRLAFLARIRSSSMKCGALLAISLPSNSALRPSPPAAGRALGTRLPFLLGPLAARLSLLSPAIRKPAHRGRSKSCESPVFPAAGARGLSPWQV